MTQADVAAATPLLEVENVTVRFGGLTALDDVSLAVRPGSVLGVIGPNGAGKTTLFNVICGFVRPAEGVLRWRGSVLSDLRPHHLAGLGIARTLQGLGLFGRQTVLDNVLTGAQRHSTARGLSTLLGLRAAARDERALRERAMTVLAELDIARYAEVYPGALPYAIQKRVSLARALVAEPEMLLLDEPASGLSGDEMGEMLTRLRELTSSTAVVLVEHHMDLVMKVCDRIVVLNFGAVIATGTPEEIQSDPTVAEAYLGAAT